MREYANVWPESGLFAFSGIDGETCHAQPFVASGSRDGIGWEFWFSPRIAFHAHVGDKRLVAASAGNDFCLSDCWHCSASVGDSSAIVTGAFLDRSSLVVCIGFEKASADCFPELAASKEGRDVRGTTVFDLEGCWLALNADKEGPTRRFGIAVSYESEKEAIRHAQAAREADVDKATEQRLAFYTSVKVPESLWGDAKRAYYKAVSVQKVNIESAQLDIQHRWCTPDRMPHRHMWLWDTAFNSLGLMHLRPDLAEDAILALFDKQREDGKLLLAAQPGIPPKEESDTQPPIVAWATWRQVQWSGRAEFLEKVYPKLVRYVEWFEANRKNANGLYGWAVRTTDDPARGARGGESGMDNSPRFDSVTTMTAVDLSSYMANEYWILEKMAKSLWRNEDANEWRKRREFIAQRVNELLWDDEDRFYYDLDQDGYFIPVKTIAGLMPLLPHIADGDQAESLRVHIIDSKRFGTELPVSSVSQDEASFCKDMWRGPTWINANILVYYGLESYGYLPEARHIAHTSMEEIVRWYTKRGCFYEYYDSMAEEPPFQLPRKGAPGAAGGVGFGVVEDLNWTAAAYIHFAHLVD